MGLLMTCGMIHAVCPIFCQWVSFMSMDTGLPLTLREEISSWYTARAENQSCDAMALMGFPSESDMIQMVRNGMVSNCPITVADMCCKGHFWCRCCFFKRKNHAPEVTRSAFGLC